MSCIRFLLVFLCVVHLLGLRRGGGRWWWQPISFPYTSVSLFSHGVFRCCPLRSFPCALVPQGLPPWGVVVQGISGRFTLFARYPLGHFLIVTLSHPLLLFLGGGGRKNILLTFIIMHSCNPNDRIDLWISSHCWAKIYLCFRRLQRSKLCWLGRLKQF